MKQLDELLEMWRTDSIIDRTEPGKALINIPQLHSKYLNILSRHRLLSKESEFKYNKMKKFLHLMNSFLKMINRNVFRIKNYKISKIKCK